MMLSCQVHYCSKVQDGNILCFERSLLFMLTEATLIWSKYTLKTNIVKFLYFKILKCSLFMWCQSCIFSIITPVFSVTWSSEIIIIADLLLRNINYCQCWKWSFCLTFLWKLIIYLRIWWIESSKEQKWFEIELFRYNTCLYLNVSLQNKSV